MDIFAPTMDKSLPIEKLQPQWQLLYLFSESVHLHRSFWDESVWFGFWQWVGTQRPFCFCDTPATRDIQWTSTSTHSNESITVLQVIYSAPSIFFNREISDMTIPKTAQFYSASSVLEHPWDNWVIRHNLRVSRSHFTLDQRWLMSNQRPGVREIY